MSRVTSKRQVTVPKDIADAYGIEPGTEIDWIPAGDSIRVEVNGRERKRRLSCEERLRLFDASRERQRQREGERGPIPSEGGRGWTREELYEDRVRPR